MNDLGIGKRVRAIRKSRKMTLQAVADGAGLAKSYVWEIENGAHINPTISTLVSLTKALGTSLDALVGLDTYLAPQLRPEAMQIAVQIDRLLRSKPTPNPQGHQDKMSETIEQRVARIERLLVLHLLDDNPMYVPEDAKERAQLTEELKAIVRERDNPPIPHQENT